MPRRLYDIWVVVGTLATTETISWGILYDAAGRAAVGLRRSGGRATVRTGSTALAAQLVVHDAASGIELDLATVMD